VEHYYIAMPINAAIAKLPLCSNPQIVARKIKTKYTPAFSELF
jgi:hypothetical protein